MAQPLNIDAFVWATGAFCQLNRIPYDASLLIKQFPPPYDVVNLQQALQNFGLNNSVKQFSIAQLPNASLPCLALLKPTSKPESNTPVVNTADQPAPLMASL